MFSIPNISLKDVSRIIKKFEDLNYGSYVRKRSKHVPTEIYLYVARKIKKCMMIFNMSVGPLITQMTNAEAMNNYEMSTQNITNLHVCSLDDTESKRINTDEDESHVCSTENKESKGCLSMHFIWMRSNKKLSYKCQYERSKRGK